MAEFTRYGEVLTDADASNQRVFQIWSPARNMVLDGVKLEFEFHNDPPFTSINVKLYSVDNDAPGLLLETSASFTKTAVLAVANVPDFDLTADAFGRFETFFAFSDRRALSKNGSYAFVVNGVWSGFGDTTHLRWNRGHPENKFGGGNTTKDVNAEFIYTPIGSDL